MLDPAITDFLESKKQDFLKKKIKASNPEDIKKKLILEASEKYKFINWIQSMIDVSDNYFSSHPPKFIHSTPLSKSSKYKSKDLNVISKKLRVNDGLLKTGNVEVDLDLSGYGDNGSSTELYSFLRLKLKDDESVIQHIVKKTKYFVGQLSELGIDYEKVRSTIIPESKSSKLTSERLKQVYFPVGNSYHLLTPLVASGMIFKLKERINELRFSDENNRVREEQKKPNPSSMSGKIEDLLELTTMGYGGANAQNVSVLNNQNGGVSFLLPSMPPTLSKRKTQPPKKDFFNDCLWFGLLQNEFEAFDKSIKGKRNINTRERRDEIVLDAIGKICWLINQVRDTPHGWSNSDSYNGLPRWQKIWLDEQYRDTRSDKKQNDDYQGKARSGFANWFIGIYKNNIHDQALLGNDDIDHIKKRLDENKEMLQ